VNLYQLGRDVPVFPIAKPLRKETMPEDLRTHISKLEEHGELKRVKVQVDWELELSHVTVVNERNEGPALLFEDIKACPDTSILMSALANPRRMALTLGKPVDTSICQLAQEWAEMTFKELTRAEEVKDGPAMENVIEGGDVDLNIFPAPRFFPLDGGRYIGTTVSIVTRDPESGKINVGTQRMQLLDEKSIGIQFMPGKTGDKILGKYRKQKKKMPATVFIGCDPLIFLAGSAMIGGATVYDSVGCIRGEPVEILTSDLTGLPFPSNAEFVMEGEVDPENFRAEGPFGEYTGYYTEELRREIKKPWVSVKRIMHRNNPILMATSTGRPVTDIHIIISFMRTATLWTELKRMMMPVKSVYMLPSSCGRFWAIVSITPRHAGDAQQVAAAVVASHTAGYGTKGIIIVDDDIEADNINDVLWALSVRYHPFRDTELIKRGRATTVDPSLTWDERLITSRIVMDATVPYEWEEKPVEIKLDEKMLEKVRQRWKEYGID
jgi:4-hydroxy-3-polyprenylbenzoate decarboxylase